MMELELQGVEAVKEAFDRLEKALAKKIIQAAIKAALPPTKSMAQSLAPRRTGAMAESIRIKAAKRSRTGFGQNVQVGKGNKGNTFYGPMQELGWKTGKRGSLNRRQIAGKHFLKTAMQKTRDQARTRAIEEIRRGIRAELNRK